MARRSKILSNVEDPAGNTVSGSYSITFDDTPPPNAKIVGITRHDGVNVFSGGSETPLDPGSTEFNQLINSDTIREQYNQINFGDKDAKKVTDFLKADGITRDGYQMGQSRESLEDQYNEAVAKYKNEQQLEFENNIENSPTRSPSDAYTVYANARGKNTTSNILAYPLDIDPEQDHMRIAKYEYFRPDEVSGKGYDAIKSSAGGPGVSGGTGGRLLTSSLFRGSIILPMPKVQDTNGAEWGESRLNVAGQAIIEAATAVGAGSVGTTPKGNVKGVSNKLAKQIKRNSRAALNRALKEQRNEVQSNRQNRAGALDIGGVLLSGAVADTANAAGATITQNDFLARSGGRVLNPNAELLFQGPVLRDFTFDFTMVARSQREGEEIRKIIRFLKTGMAAKFANAAFLRTPDIFTLEYRRGNVLLDTVNRFNPTGLALRTFTVDYAPNGYWSAYRDSQPTSLKMSLNFAELKPIFDVDQEQGNPTTSVGY